MCTQPTAIAGFILMFHQLYGNFKNSQIISNVVNPTLILQ